MNFLRDYKIFCVGFFWILWDSIGFLFFLVISAALFSSLFTTIGDVKSRDITLMLGKMAALFGEVKSRGCTLMLGKNGGGLR